LRTQVLLQVSRCAGFTHLRASFKLHFTTPFVRHAASACCLSSFLSHAAQQCCCYSSPCKACFGQEAGVILAIALNES
jgi:hypothetical protein